MKLPWLEMPLIKMDYRSLLFKDSLLSHRSQIIQPILGDTGLPLFQLDMCVYTVHAVSFSVLSFLSLNSTFCLCSSCDKLLHSHETWLQHWMFWQHNKHSSSFSTIIQQHEALMKQLTTSSVFEQCLAICCGDPGLIYDTIKCCWVGLDNLAWGPDIMARPQDK